jgi:hypothetical protein
MQLASGRSGIVPYRCVPPALVGWIAGRYLVDFAPEPVLPSWLLLAAWWQGVRGWSQWQSRLLQCVVTGLTLYCLSLDL